MSAETTPIHDTLAEEYAARYQPKHAGKSDLLLGVFHGTGHTGIDAATIMLAAFLTIVIIGLMAWVLAWWL